MIRNALFKTARSYPRVEFKLNNHISITQVFRCLYTKEALGLDNFVPQSDRLKDQMGNMTGKFKEKMNGYADPQGGSTNMIFSEDLKIMLHLAEDEKDVDVAVAMIKKFNGQNKEMRFGTFVFGPVVMRMFHHLNLPQKALECFKAPELNGFFDQIITYQILMDLLYENKMYQEVLQVLDMIGEKQIEGYPKNPVVLALAACYKMNTKESLEYALNLWKKLTETGHNPMRRATTFCAALAINQGEPSIALEILASARKQNYTTVRNLKILALAKVGGVEQALPILKSVLSEDDPNMDRKHTFNKEAIEALKGAVAKTDNPEFVVEFNRMELLLQKQGLITDTLLEEQLCQDIQKRFIQNQQNFQRNSERPYRRQEGGYRGDSRRSYNYKENRPGLNDLQ